MVTIHIPRIEKDGAASAAITLKGSVDRLSARVEGITISDVDDVWTRGFVLSGSAGESYAGVFAADAAVAAELEAWHEAHSQALGRPADDREVTPSVRKAGEAQFLTFRSPPNHAELRVGDRCDVALELRGLRRGAGKSGYSLLWRANEATASAESIDRIASDIRYLAEKLSRYTAERDPMAIPN